MPTTYTQIQTHYIPAQSGGQFEMTLLTLDLLNDIVLERYIGHLVTPSARNLSVVMRERVMVRKSVRKRPNGK